MTTAHRALRPAGYLPAAGDAVSKRDWPAAVQAVDGSARAASVPNAPIGIELGIATFSPA